MTTTTLEKPVRLLLIDDHDVVREGLRLTLSEFPDFQIVGEFSRGADAIAQVAVLRPDIVILDLRMPGCGPVATMRGLRERWPTVRIIVFSSFATTNEIHTIVEAGAQGYVSKDVPLCALVDAIRAVRRGAMALGSDVQRLLAETVRSGGSVLNRLTTRELSVLESLATGLSNKQIGFHLGLTEGTVKGYVSQVLEKLGLDDRTQAALFAARHGVVALT